MAPTAGADPSARHQGVAPGDFPPLAELDLGRPLQSELGGGDTAGKLTVLELGR